MLAVSYRVTCVVLVCGVGSAWGQAPSSLRLIVALYRHGERTPVLTCPTDPNTEHLLRVGLGQLTTAGMRMHYELGSFLRRRYRGFLHERYHRNYTRVRSADYDRTLMSAEANLAGLYPPSPAQRFNSSLAWQPIPVHTEPLSQDLLLEFPTACAEYGRQLQQALQLPELAEEVAHLQPLFRFLSTSCGIPVSDTLTAMYLYDLLDVERRLHLPLPAWHNATVFDQRLFPELLGAVNQLSFRLLSFTPQLRRLGGGGLLAQFLADMNATVSGAGPARQLLAYSGHDSDISALLGALGLFDPRSGAAPAEFVTPPLASCVLFELHRLGGQHHVRVVFRTPADGDAARSLVLPGCSDGPEAGCLWPSLLRRYRPLLPDDLRAECEGSPPAGEERQHLLLLLYVSLVLTVLLMIALCVLGLLRQRVLMQMLTQYHPIAPTNKSPAFSNFYGSISP